MMKVPLPHTMCAANFSEKHGGICYTTRTLSEWIHAFFTGFEDEIIECLIDRAMASARKILTDQGMTVEQDALLLTTQSRLSAEECLTVWREVIDCDSGFFEIDDKYLQVRHDAA